VTAMAFAIDLLDATAVARRETDRVLCCSGEVDFIVSLRHGLTKYTFNARFVCTS
jgi:hypothetical protein